MNSLQSEIEGLYGKAKVCVGHGKCLPLEPGEKINMLWPQFIDKVIGLNISICSVNLWVFMGRKLWVKISLEFLNQRKDFNANFNNILLIYFLLYPIIVFNEKECRFWDVLVSKIVFRFVLIYNFFDLATLCNWLHHTSYFLCTKKNHFILRFIKWHSNNTGRPLKLNALNHLERMTLLFTYKLITSKMI